MRSVGQPWVLHVSFSARCGQALPPFERLPERERVVVPEPHERVQAVHDDHCDTVQSTGHGEVLHSRSAVRFGHW
jgi:hypothetical protein